MPDRRVILCNCGLPRWQRHDKRYHQCLNWLCICGNSKYKAGFCQVSQWREGDPTYFQCCACERVFNGTTGLELSQVRQVVTL